MHDQKACYLFLLNFLYGRETKLLIHSQTRYAYQEIVTVNLVIKEQTG